MSMSEDISEAQKGGFPDLSARAFFAAILDRPSPGDVQAVLSLSRFGAVLTGLNAIVYLVAVGPNEEWLFLLPWCLATLSIAGFVALRSRRASRRRVARVSRKAAQRLNVFAVLLGLPWAALALLVFVAGTPIEQLLALIVCAGMAAGGSFMMHRTLTAACCYYAVILGAVIVGCLLTAAELLWPVAVYTVIYGASLAYFAFMTGAFARDREQLTVRLSQAAAELGQAQKQISKLALHDSVSGLPNRLALTEQLSVACSSQRPFWLLIIGLDHFARVNDALGHSLGDRFLAVVAARLRDELRKEDFVARFSADEYAVLLPGSTKAAEIRSLGQRLIKAISQPTQLAGKRVAVTASAGAAHYPDDGADAKAILSNAGTAMHHVKTRQRGQIQLYLSDLGAIKAETDQMEVDLRAALERNEFAIHYQPKIDLLSGAVAGAEALLRWHHAERGLVPPDRFLPVAAERNLMQQITSRIFDIVSADIAQWRNGGLATGRIAVNIHAEDLKRPAPLMERLRALLAAGITPDDLYVEVTENCVVGDGSDAASVVLDAIVDLGFELSLDDFGTGHASLSHLKRLPVSEIKIDRSFVECIAEVPQDRAIVTATIGMARGMGLRTVAEGVEGVRQARLLRDLGADLGQGYYWARPMPAAQFADFVRKAGARDKKAG